MPPQFFDGRWKITFSSFGVSTSGKQGGGGCDRICPEKLLQYSIDKNICMIRIPPTFTATSGTLHFFYEITKNAFGETIRKKEKILTFTTLADIMIVGSALIMTVAWNATFVDLEK